MQADLRGEKAFVTGASRGIGRAVALRLAKEGADVCLTARSADLLDSVTAECQAFGVRAYSIVADAADTEAMQQAVEKAVELMGGLSIVVNNAGIAVGYWLPFPKWAKAMQVNAVACMAVAHQAISHLERNGGGAIIQISSVAGQNAVGPLTPYCASKWAVQGFSKSLFYAVREKKIKVCTICPGLVHTDMGTKLSQQVDTMIKGEDIAETVTFIVKFPKNACPTEITIMPQVDDLPIQSNL